MSRALGARPTVLLFTFFIITTKNNHNNNNHNSSSSSDNNSNDNISSVGSSSSNSSSSNYSNSSSNSNKSRMSDVMDVELSPSRDPVTPSKLAAEESIWHGTGKIKVPLSPTGHSARIRQIFQAQLVSRSVFGAECRREINTQGREALDIRAVSLRDIEKALQKKKPVNPADYVPKEILEEFPDLFAPGRAGQASPQDRHAASPAALCGVRGSDGPGRGKGLLGAGLCPRPGLLQLRPPRVTVPAL
ncbi:retrovirus polyprotein [Ophiocordyceps camponoti-floridani]|uniref:Retrovirus polyprotein n=1 Tax=Ophiocordyceps camponoti-floridani TaxID=2030778 RepID=A0A8H4VCL3_9HYPO|nr:retrovirus polyprotein [Ophiocordyceps camponoti-floridani]